MRLRNRVAGRCASIGPYGEGRSAYTDVGAGALDGPWRTDSIAGISAVRLHLIRHGLCRATFPSRGRLGCEKC